MTANIAVRDQVRVFVTIRDRFHRLLTKKRRRHVEICPLRKVELSMSSRAASLLVRRTDPVGSGTVVSAGKELTKAHADTLSRAAVFRIEADVLRERARVTDEAAIREQYLALADRWTMFASSLEAELMNRSACAH